MYSDNKRWKQGLSKMTITAQIMDKKWNGCIKCQTDYKAIINNIKHVQ